MANKVSFGVNKAAWRPSSLAGQIVLVTTLNEDGSSNVAPKSWISMMAFEPAILALGCNLSHWTARNILTRREFVINVPGADLAAIVWRSHRLPHPRPVEAVGLTSLPALAVAPPRIAECLAHLECVLDQHLVYGEEVILLGRIVAASGDEELCDAADPYARMRMLVYLEAQTYGVIERSWHVNAEEAGPGRAATAASTVSGVNAGI